MTHLLEEIKLDVNFVKSHSLQPKWYKALKVVILVGFLAGYGYLFGALRPLAGCAVSGQSDVRPSRCKNGSGCPDPSVGTALGAQNPQL
jgi:hypothetical protein